MDVTAIRAAHTKRRHSMKCAEKSRQLLLEDLEACVTKKLHP
jgi:hypothetical protein